MTQGSDKAEVANGSPGLTHSEEEWLKKSSGPGKVRFVPLSLPGGRVLQHLVCGSMSIEPIFLDSNGRVYFFIFFPPENGETLVRHRVHRMSGVQWSPISGRVSAVGKSAATSCQQKWTHTHPCQLERRPGKGM